MCVYRWGHLDLAVSGGIFSGQCDVNFYLSMVTLAWWDYSH